MAFVPGGRGPAGSAWRAVHCEVAQAKKRCGLPESAPVVRCSAAGRDGCWLHRFLQVQGLPRSVVDASSIALNRRQRRAKSEGVDVRKLLRMLRRFHSGDREGWRVVPVPSVAAEDQRPLHRALDSLTQERASTTPRIQGVRSRQGIRLTSLRTLPAPRDALRRWDGAPRPRGRRRRCLRVDAPHPCLRAQMAAVDAARRAVLEISQAASRKQIRQLMPLRGIGIKGAWVWVRAFFGGRDVKNRREVRGLAGVTPPP